MRNLGQSSIFITKIWCASHLFKHSSINTDWRNNYSHWQKTKKMSILRPTISGNRDVLPVAKATHLYHSFLVSHHLLCTVKRNLKLTFSPERIEENHENNHFPDWWEAISFVWYRDNGRQHWHLFSFLPSSHIGFHFVILFIPVFLVPDRVSIMVGRTSCCHERRDVFCRYGFEYRRFSQRDKSAPIFSTRYFSTKKRTGQRSRVDFWRPTSCPSTLWTVRNHGLPCLFIYLKALKRGQALALRWRCRQKSNSRPSSYFSNACLLRQSIV